MFNNKEPHELTMQDVIQIQNDTLYLISGGEHAMNGKGQPEKALINELINKEIQHLTKLQETFKAREEKLYEAAGEKTQFFQKVKAWSDSTNKVQDLLRNSTLINLIVAKMKEYKRLLLLDLEKSWEEALSQIESTNPNFAQEFVIQQVFSMASATSEDFKQQIAGILSETAIPKIVRKGGGKHKGGKGSGKDKAQFISLEFQLSSKNKIPKISQQLEAFIKGESDKTRTLGVTVQSNIRQNKLEIRFLNAAKTDTLETLQKTLKQELLKNQDEASQIPLQINSTLKHQIYAHIKEIILQYIPDTNSKIYSVYKTVLDKHFIKLMQYDLNTNPQVVKGFLGELYWTAFFYDFFGDRSSTVNINPLGRDKVPTDIEIGKLVGFQVKNYSVEKGVVHFNSFLNEKTNELEVKKVSLSALFGNRLGLGQRGKEVMGQFYFSYYYNQRNVEIDTDEKYIPAVNRFNSIFQTIESYVENNQSALLNFDNAIDYFGLQDGVYNANQSDLVRPTFFAINTKIIPSSEMVQEIILNLQAQLDNTAVPSAYIKFTNTSFIYNEKYDTLKENPWNTPVKDSELSNPNKLLTHSYFQYAVEVNIEELFSRLLKTSLT